MTQIVLQELKSLALLEFLPTEQFLDFFKNAFGLNENEEEQITEGQES